jgi:O-acetyl-ADP-ribose deacetylase (regulator of RNase III)
MQQVRFGNVLNEVTKGVIVQGCNAQGVMGSGIAKEIREKWPQVYTDYKLRQSTAGLKLGTFVATTIVPKEFYIYSAITQEYFGKDGAKYVSYKAIHQAFYKMAIAAGDAGLDIHYPMIGAGLGGGEWSVIQACVDDAFRLADQEVLFPVKRTLWILE